MPKNIQLQKNLELTDELTQFILKHPDTQERLPKRVSIVVFSERDQALNKANEGLLKTLVEKGEKVVVAIKTRNKSRPWKFESSTGLALI